KSCTGRPGWMTGIGAATWPSSSGLRRSWSWWSGYETVWCPRRFRMDTDTALADLYDTYPGAPDLSALMGLVRDAGAVGRNPLAALTSTLLNAGLSTDEAEVSADA